jgi:hypothetical protein
LKTTLPGLAALACLVVLAAPADAAPFQYSLTFEIQTVSGTAASRFPLLQVGSLIQGRFTYESELVDEDPLDPSHGFYTYTAPTDAPVASVDVGGLELEWSFIHFVTGDNSPSTGEDLFGVGAYFGFIPALDVTYAGFNLWLATSNLDVLSSDALPPRLPVEQFDSMYSENVEIAFADGSYVNFGVLPTAIQPIPEPSSLVLMASGILGAAYIACRKR